MNLRPSGYEPDELPDCSTPHRSSPLFYRALVRIQAPERNSIRGTGGGGIPDALGPAAQGSACAQTTNSAPGAMPRSSTSSAFALNTARISGEPSMRAASTGSSKYIIFTTRR